MKIAITVVENRMPGMGRRVSLAADAPASDSVNERTETRDLWLPDGSEVYETIHGEMCVRVPGRRLGMTLGDAYILYEKYATS